MISKMLQDEVFCLRNWAVYVNTIKITITASYNSGLPDESVKLDLKNRYTELDGMVIIIEKQQPSRIFIGTHDKSISSFTIELENEGLPVRALQLEYSIVDSVAACDPQNDSWEYTQLVFDKLEFTREPEGFSVNMTITAGNTSTAVQSEEPAKYICCKEDLIGNIKADLDIACFYRNGTEGSALISDLQAVLDQSAEISDDQLLSFSLELEVRLMALINSTQQSIRLYRKSLLDDNQ